MPSIFTFHILYGVPFWKKLITFLRTKYFLMQYHLVFVDMKYFFVLHQPFFVDMKHFLCNINRILSTPHYFLCNVKLFLSTQIIFRATRTFCFEHSNKNIITCQKIKFYFYVTQKNPSFTHLPDTPKPVLSKSCS